MRLAGVFGRALGFAVAAAAMTSLSWLATPASADVFYYKDAEGVYHFTNVRRPDAVPFITDQPMVNPAAVRVDRNIPDIDTYDTIIDRWSKRFQVQKSLIKAVIRAESGFNPRAVSSAGARGLMQLMPDTARFYKVSNVYDPEENIRGGVQHLKLLLERHGRNIPHALAAYNAGSDIVDRYKGIPRIAETQDYVARVLRF